MLRQNQKTPGGTAFNNLDYRSKQVENLKKFIKNAIEVSPFEEYCIHFMAFGRDMTLTVTLDTKFTNERPKLRVSPIVDHSWVNSQTGEITSAPSLLNFSAQSELGRVIQDVIKEFEQYRYGSLKKQLNSENVENSISINSFNGSNNTKENFPVEMSFGLKIPNSECNYPNLSNLTLNELKQLDTDQDFLDDFIEEQLVIQNLNAELDSMINQVDLLSRENQSKETNILELKRKLSDDVVAIMKLGEKCERLNQEYLKKSEAYDPRQIRILLKNAVMKADSDCDSHVEKLLSGAVDVQTFLNRYTYTKKLSTERKVKEERLGQQLSALERAGI